MKIKLPIIIGGIFLLMSLPFMFGLMQPSMHEGGYSAIYVFLNMPGLMVVSGFAKKIETILMNDIDLKTSNQITLALLFIFWTSSSFILGVFIDAIQKRRKVRQA